MSNTAVILNNELGLHARPAALLVKEASKFKSQIYIIKDEKQYNAKSIMGILSMGAVKGDELNIKAEGEDEVQAINAIKKLIENIND